MKPDMQKRVLGIDIGGANLKYASACGTAAAREFAMWLHPEQLSQSLIEDVQMHFIARGIRPDELAVTMTGELADCFLDREIGVEHIVQQTCQAAETLAIRNVHFYGVDGRFHQSNAARENTDLIAAANWHALANFVGREIASDALLIDIGSTTTDIIPITGQNVATDALTDYERLCDGSLVYIGCRRTPICSLVSNLEYRGISTPVMNELFATIDDAMLLLGHTDENVHDCSSADGKPRTQLLAANRVARMIGLDRRTINTRDAENLAQQVIAAAFNKIGHGIRQHQQHSIWVLSGHGQVLISIPDQQPTLYLADHLGTEVARCAPAYAVARLKSTENK
ncbi:tetrahydromethanopterin-linked C1 transfer pathway [Rubripirellula sp.]|nr:tetrahydromethanopterin-linked C1 transfer pathway [Rubripirellula sp.]MDB4730331.1 tetrahydromethanopterin-linked C1 transfer pathway [bacterium]